MGQPAHSLLTVIEAIACDTSFVSDSFVELLHQNLEIMLSKPVLSAAHLPELPDKTLRRKRNVFF
ncbi:hypothetical protein QW71_25590 [Paenibacillus sp. IHB B 3415]|nr:hypothetical protein QW71_25590 [Paenibacillus sp. IHB B 3415]